MDAIDELGKLASVLRIEQREDYALHDAWLKQSSIQERKRNGITWFPLRIVETGYGIGSYPFVVVERNPGDKLDHKFQSAAPVSMFSAADGNYDFSLTGTVGYVDDQRMKITFFVDELPDWMDDGKLGVNLLFDTRTYDEMFKALSQLINAEKGRLKQLRDVILGNKEPTHKAFSGQLSPRLNESQNVALKTICSAEDVAIVHGPPGTGKTTTLVESMMGVLKEERQIMVCAPSNAATDHLAKCLSAKGLRVVRLGNLAKVETQLEARPRGEIVDLFSECELATEDDQRFHGNVEVEGFGGYEHDVCRDQVPEELELALESHPLLDGNPVG